MASTKINLVVEAGATFHFVADLTDANNQPIRVLGYTAAAQMRKSYQSNAAFDFITTLEDGLVTLEMAANTTATIEPGRYVYDVMMYGANTTIRIIEGLATVTGRCTQ